MIPLMREERPAPSSTWERIGYMAGALYVWAAIGLLVLGAVLFVALRILPLLT